MFRNQVIGKLLAAFAVVLSVGFASVHATAAASATPAKSAVPTRKILDRRAASFTPMAQQLIAQNPKYKLHHAAKAKAAAVGGAWQSPYDRFLKPIMDKHLAKARAAAQHAGSARASMAGATSSKATGLAANFPGFRMAPMVKGSNPSDPNSTFISLSADVNKDGKADLVSVQNDGTVNVMLNPGTGKFSDFAVTSTNTTAVNDIVYDMYGTIVDLNGDGYPDLEVMDGSNNRIYIYMNKKDGTFQDPVYTTFTFQTGAQFYGNAGSVLFIDVNGDKIPDMVAAIPYGSFSDEGVPETTFTIQTSLGKGDGTFAAPLPEQQAVFNAYLFDNFGETVAADMNNDGKIDLVFLAGGFDATFNDTSLVFTVLGKGDGTFGSFPSDFPTSGAVLPGVPVNGYESLAVSDVDGDGKPDVLFSVGDGNIYSALGTGDGQFGNVITSAAQLSSILIGGPQIVHFADLDGDGILDAIGYNWGFVSVNLGTGKGKFSTTPLVQLISGEGGDQQPAAADFNGDGKLDFVQVDFVEARVDFFAGGNWAQAGAAAMAVNGESAQTLQVMAVGDFNGDGIPDVFAADFNGVPVNPNGGDDDAITYTPPTQGLGVNGTYPNLKVGINDGKGNFTYTTAIDNSLLFPIGGSWIAPVAVDLNNDGKADVVMGDFPGLAISLNNGDGTFANPVQIALGQPTPCHIAYVDIGDLNGDGAPDIVAAYPGDASCDAYTQVTQSGFFILLNDKKGGFTSSFIEYGYGAYLPKLADLNGDGMLDLVLADINDPGLEYYLYAIPGNGDGTFNLGGATELLENTVVTAIIPGDFDGDGKVDLALGIETQVDGNGEPLYNTTGTNLMLGNGDFTFGLPVQYSAGIFPIAGTASDFNADGRPDLAMSMLTFDAYTDIQTSSFVYMVNLGGGGFGPAVQTSAPAETIGEIFAADINGDGAIDALQDGWVLGFSGVSGLYLNSGAISLGLTSSASSVVQGSSATLTATLTADVSTNSPTGTVTFSSNGVVIGIVPVSGGAAVLSISSLPVGSNSITAVYSGDANFNAATSSAVVVTVGAMQSVGLNLSASATSVVQNSNVTLTASFAATQDTSKPSGTVSFLNNGTVIGIVPVSSGTASLTVSSLPVGTDSITAVYSGDANFNAATSSAVVVTVNAIQSLGLNLSASATSVSQDSSVTLTASFAATQSASKPSGTVSFLNNGTVIGIVPISSRAASLTVSSLPVGTDSVTAVYSGDGNFSAATSAAVTITVTTLTPAITLQAFTPGSLTLVQGRTGTVTSTIAADATFAGKVAFTCTGAPAETTCNVSPAAVTLSGGQSSVITVVVATTSPNNQSEAQNSVPANGPSNRLPGWAGASGMVSVAGAAFFLLGPSRRRRTMRGIGLVFLIGAGLVSAMGIGGCGGSGKKFPGTPVGTSTLTITATSGTLTQTTNVSLTVTK
jgi:hypothetical protein